MCGHCGFVCNPDSRFCGGCGKPLPPDASGGGKVNQGKPRFTSAAERRQLTVMFCDMVGSTDLAVRLDPEEVSDIFRQYQGACEQVISRYDGYIARYTGDGLLVYFGYPRATEHDAERAVRAGLEIIDSVCTLRLGLQYTIRTRIGIASGEVVVGEVVGDGPSREATVVGETPNLASRLQGVSDPDRVIISRGTRELLGGLFEYTDLGFHALKGFDSPVRAYAVTGESAMESRFEATHGAPLGLLLGRDREIELLQECWKNACRGERQVALVSGDEGIGKSRLVENFLASVTPPAGELMRLYGAPHARGNVLHPVISHWQRKSGIQTSDSPSTKIDKLEKRLALLGPPDADDLGLLAALLSIPVSGRIAAPTPSPPELKSQTLNLLVEQVTRRCQLMPVLLVVEDLHWLDATTQEFLVQLIDAAQQLPLLIVGTYRPGHNTRWVDQVSASRIELGRLDSSVARAIIEQIGAQVTLPEKIVANILEKTDGIPLFIEELTKTVLENPQLADRGYAADRETLQAIPTTLQDSLHARLDRLGPLKEIAQIASAIGREFRLDLLLALVDSPPETVNEAIDQLVAAQLITSRGAPPHQSFIFRHALVQDIAYSSMLHSTRRRLHAHIARTLAQRFRAQVQGRPDVLARHYTQAHLHEQAFRYWFIASQKALAQFAHKEVALHLSQGLSLTEKLPEDVELIAMEFEMRAMLGSTLIMLHGPGNSEVGEAYQQAYDFCLKHKGLQDSFRVKFGLCYYHWARGSIREAVSQAEALLPEVDIASDPGQFMAAHALLGVSLWHSGESHRALGCLQKVSAAYNPERDSPLFFSYMLDFGVFGRFYEALALLFIGRQEESGEAARASLALARQLKNPHAIGFGLLANFMVAMFSEEFEECIEIATECINLANAHGFEEFVAMAKVCIGAAQLKLGEAEGSLELILEGISQWEATGFGAWRPLLHGVLADAHLQLGQVDLVRSELNTAQELMAEQEERQASLFLLSIERKLLSRAKLS